MKSLINNISALLTLLIAVVLVSSCSNEYPEPATPQSEYSLNFEISLPTFDVVSRAPQGSYDPGTDQWENYIDVERDMRIYFFDATSNELLFAADPDSTFVTPLETGEGSSYKRYMVRSMFKNTLPANIKTLVLANCGPDNYPSIDANGYMHKPTYNGGAAFNSLDDLCEAMIYSLSEPLTSLDADHLIPMFGIKSTSGIEFIPDHAVQLGQINMLRALAKLEISTVAGEAALTDVYITRTNTSGLIMPRLTDWLESEYVKNSYQSDYVDHLSMIGSNNESASTANSSVRLVANGTNPETGTTRYIIYLPEYSNTGANENSAKLQLLFENEISYRTVELKYYSKTLANLAGKNEGDHFDVQRNFYYRFTVSKSAMELQVVAEVHPYYTKVLNPEFGIETGEPIWEGLWYASTDQYLSFDDLSATYFDWSTIPVGSTMTFYFINLAPANHPEYCHILIQTFLPDASNNKEAIIGTDPAGYFNPSNDFIDVTISQSVINQINQYSGLSLWCRGLILYRITLK